MRGARLSSASADGRGSIACGPPDGGAESIVTPDGTVAFKLASDGSRLFVQRTQRTADRLVAVQCLLIRTVDDFRRWCDVEPLRFEHPVVFDQLRRYGDEVFAHGR